MRKLLRASTLLVAATLTVPAFMPEVAAASPVDQQRQRVEDIVDELERLEEQARLIGEQYVVAVDAKAQLDIEIEQSEAQVAAKEAEIVKLRGDLGEMAVRSFVGAGSAPLGPLFEDTSDISAVMQRDELARVALSAGTITTDELNSIVADLEDERAALDRKRAEAEQLAASLVESQAETERLTSEYTQARADAEAKLGQLIAEEEARRAAESLRRMQAEAAAEAAAAAASAANSTASSGGNSGGSTANSGGSNSSSSAAESSSNSGGSSSSSAGSNSNSGNATASAGSGGGSSEPSTPAPKVSSRAGTAVNAAMGQLGVPYRYATSNPGVSFDCSGLTKYAWGRAGVSLPHQSRQQYASIPHVSKSEAQPGDLIFFYSPISHVSIYLGGGQQVHAPNTGSSVKVGSVNWSKVTGVGRPG